MSHGLPCKIDITQPCRMREEKRVVVERMNYLYLIETVSRVHGKLPSNKP